MSKSPTPKSKKSLSHRLNRSDKISVASSVHNRASSACMSVCVCVCVCVCPMRASGIKEQIPSVTWPDDIKTSKPDSTRSLSNPRFILNVFHFFNLRFCLCACIVIFVIAFFLGFSGLFLIPGQPIHSKRPILR